ncbi:MAG: type II toxin-antitoxin system prevent-host-death family antitoxin [Acidobacteria bacterium]|nr:type II toxin-antitoxin system prevent-host-death family antitoxin [Acidobacteriota bacterium]
MNQVAKVSELKAKLSGYLARVRGGATVTVCDRRTPIAKLVPFDGDSGGIEVREPIDAGGLPLAPRIALRKKIDVVALLLEDREHR